MSSPALANLGHHSAMSSPALTNLPSIKSSPNPNNSPTDVDILNSLVLPNTKSPALSLTPHGSPSPAADYYADALDAAPPDYTLSEAPRTGLGIEGLTVTGVEMRAQGEAARAAATAAAADTTMGNTTSNTASPRIPTAPSLPQEPPKPIPLGSARNTENIQRLYQLCQPRGVRPIFSFHPSGQQWTASLKLDHVEIEGEGTFVSHADGKEWLAERGCEIVGGWAVLGKEGRGRVDGQEGEGVEENWIGLLGEFTQTALKHQPSYEAFQVSHQTFSTTVKLPGFPVQHPPFGSRTIAYNTKKAAKAGAARDAVLWLRKNGFLTVPGAEDCGGKENSKGFGYGRAAKGLPRLGTPVGIKVKMPSAAGTGTAGNANGISGNSNAADTAAGASTSYAAVPGQSRSHGQQAQQLREELGLPTPVYRLDPGTGTLSSTYNGHASFEGPGGVHNAVLPEKLHGELASVRGIFGKTHAKEEISRKLVMLLEGLKNERLQGAVVAEAMVE